MGNSSTKSKDVKMEYKKLKNNPINDTTKSSIASNKNDKDENIDKDIDKYTELKNDISSIFESILPASFLAFINTDKQNDVKIKHDEKTTKIMKVVKTTTDYTHALVITVNNEDYVKMFLDPMRDLKMKDMAYLIGYKMTYIVDEYRQRIENVIAIVTMRIHADNNIIFQSEKNTGHKQKEYYALLKLSNNTHHNKGYTRDEQAESLRYTGGNMVAWEHSTKYCAHNVETIGLTFCGKFKDVIKACHKYDNNLAFAESAYTFEEKQKPVIYEVGVVNRSKFERPRIGLGGCLDFFHFFLRPEYAIDYGFWQFQMADGKSDVNRTEIVLGKQFSNIRHINYKECYGEDHVKHIKTIRKKRNNVSLIKDPNNDGYVSNQIISIRNEQDKMKKDADQFVDMIAQDIKKDIEKPISNVISSPNPENNIKYNETITTNDQIIESITINDQINCSDVKTDQINSDNVKYNETITTNNQNYSDIKHVDNKVRNMILN